MRKIKDIKEEIEELEEHIFEKEIELDALKTELNDVSRGQDDGGSK